MRSRPSRSARSLKTQYLFAAAIPALIVTLSITGFVWAQKQVTVVADGQISRFKTQATDVASLLSQADIALGSGDVVTPSPGSPVSSGMTVLVRHATPITIDLGGEQRSMNVVGATVADVLVAAGIDPDANPAVEPEPATPLQPGMKITVPKVFSRLSHEDVALPFGHRTVRDPLLPAGVRKLVTAGRAGVRLRLFRSLVSDGVEGPKALTAEKTVTPPVDELVAIGSASHAVGNRAIRESARALRGVRSLEPPSRGRRMVAEVTGYTPGDAGVNHTCATGAYATHGVIAVDPRIIPLGTHVFIPGYGYAVAADTGGAIKGNRIDLCYDTREECIQWGRRTLTIIILD